MNTYTAIILEDQGWYVGWIAEVPGANSQARSIAELRENLAEAVQLILAANRQQAELAAGDKPVRREPLTVA